MLLTAKLAVVGGRGCFVVAVTLVVAMAQGETEWEGEVEYSGADYERSQRLVLTVVVPIGEDRRDRRERSGAPLNVVVAVVVPS